MVYDFNRYLFDLVFGLHGRNFLIDDLGVLLAKYLSYALVAGAFLFLFRRETQRQRIFFLSEAALALIVSRGLLTEIIRFFYPNPRPFEALHFTPFIAESGGSFPSGHAAFFFALAMVLWCWNRRWGTWYAAAAALNGLARIFVGVHWPLDVLGGAVVGVVSGLFVYVILSPYRRKLKKENAVAATK